MDRNFVRHSCSGAAGQSLSARRAWIEIGQHYSELTLRGVALRKESVDRNSTLYPINHNGLTVALRKESVDRNDDAKKKAKEFGGSLSARRAWIEIIIPCAHCLISKKSLSARRAWIEIDLVSLIGAAADGRSPQGERG